MKLQLSTWPEIEAYLKRSTGVIVPTGSTEQHGPTGLIGTDTLCAEAVADLAAERADALVAPSLGYAPAQFNMAFPGTVSVPAVLFAQMFIAICTSLSKQGFRRIYVLNGHGANLAALQTAVHDLYDGLGDEGPRVLVRSWWDFEAVGAIREELFGAGEGLHATPSEIAITQAVQRVVAGTPPAVPPLQSETLRALAGDRHAPAEAHRRQFPDGRVGSDAGLARPEHGERLLEAAAEAVAQDYGDFVAS